MNVFTDDFILGVATGIAIASLAFYLILRIESRILLRRAKKRMSKWASKGKEVITNPVSVVRSAPIEPQKNLNKETVHLDLKVTMQLLERYQRQATPELKHEIHQHLQGHTPEGNNFLHEYLSLEKSEEKGETAEPNLETVKEALEIEPELLFEENHHGETALHIAEQHEHFEIAEELVEAKHFSSHEQRHHFLMHADHHGHNALHTMAHMWHLTHAGEHWHKGLEHLMHMLETFPKEALQKKDDDNKTAQELLLAMNEYEKKMFVEALMHKGLVHAESGHLTTSAELKHILHIDTANTYHNIATLAELYVNSYPHYVGEAEALKAIKSTQHQHPTPSI